MGSGLNRAKRTAIELAHKHRSDYAVVDSGDTTGQVSRYRVMPTNRVEADGEPVFVATPETPSPDANLPRAVQHYNRIGPNRYKCAGCGKQVHESGLAKHLKERHPGSGLTK